MRYWFLGAVAVVFVALTLASLRDEGGLPTRVPIERMLTARGQASVAPIEFAVATKDLPQLRFSCEESERVLREGGEPSEVHDWTLLAPICDLGLAADWAGAEERLEAIPR
jgi:hypothetical protein